MNQAKVICTYFRHHSAHFFPALRQRHRTPFVRQAANLWHLKEQIGQRLLTQTRCDPGRQLVDRFPLPACQFARAYRGPRFRGEGVIVRFRLAPAHVPETTVVPEWVHGQQGIVVGDRHYGSPPLPEAWAPQGLPRRAPFKKAKHDPGPGRRALLSRFRYRINTVFDPLVDRYPIQRVWARDR